MQKKLNKLAIIGFCLAVLWFPLSLTITNVMLERNFSAPWFFTFPVLAVIILILNAVASRNAKANAEKGRGFAISGIIFSIIGLLLGSIYGLMMISLIASA